ncbi:hypothetical protein BJY04DRAFT_192953 [Aspergillus karnatakaensis]|uniref:uncharacterized protein n=1 Tax=Aspergillus karnatakaensis TaxID=1810916 RepID=UPI003CCD730D
MGAGDKDARLKEWSDGSDMQPSLLSDNPVSGVSLACESSVTDISAPAVPKPKTNQQSQSTSQSKSFEFVLVNDNESRRQVRRHAMRQYMHQRRLDSIARLGTARVPAAGWTARFATDSSSAHPSDEPVGHAQNGVSIAQEKGSPPTDEEQHSSGKGKGKVPSRRALPKAPKVKREDTGFALVSKFQHTSPPIVPDRNAARDPFSSYPIPISDVDHELIQHFVVTYPTMMYKFIDSAAIDLNPMKDIFRHLALHDDLPFQAMLAIASKHRAGVEGKKDSVQSLTHKMRALRLMNERIKQDAEGRNDGTIYAVATMAVIEKWSRDASVERTHFGALASMIRNRGGMQAMHTTSPFLGKVLYWVDFSCAPNAIVGTALPWTGAIPDTAPTGFDFLKPDIHLPIPHKPRTHIETEALCEQFRACEDFLGFFRHLHELERTALNSPSTLASSTVPPRRKSFTAGTKLHSIITVLPYYDHGIRDAGFIDEYTCMTCLFFLAVALYHSYTTFTSFDYYLNWLERQVDSLNSYENPSITSILWLFLQNGGFIPGEEQKNSGARCWVVSRMVRTAKHLQLKQNGRIWITLLQVLTDFIVTQQECALAEEFVDEEALSARAQKRDSNRENDYIWDENEMRREILGSRTPAQIEAGPGQFTNMGVGDANIPILT